MCGEGGEGDKQSFVAIKVWTRIGVGDKTVWDWLQLLIVPLALSTFGL